MSALRTKFMLRSMLILSRSCCTDLRTVGVCAPIGRCLMTALRHKLSCAESKRFGARWSRVGSATRSPLFVTNSRIKLHLQQWNRMDRAARTGSQIQSSVSRGDLSNEIVEANGIFQNDRHLQRSSWLGAIASGEWLCCGRRLSRY